MMTDLSFFPPLNAGLNGLAGIFLVLGWVAIRQRKVDQHRVLMLGAFVTSILFLISYVTYHCLRQGMVSTYGGHGLLKAIYFTILISHTILAVGIIPFILMALW